MSSLSDFLPNKIEWDKAVQRRVTMKGTDRQFMYAWFKVNGATMVHMIAVEEPLDPHRLAEAIAAVLLDSRLNQKAS